MQVYERTDLEVNGETFAESLPGLFYSIFCVTIKNGKVADAILAEERPGHGAVESSRGRRSALHSWERTHKRTSTSRLNGDHVSG